MPQIRRMFEDGARLKQERGAVKVFDFTLGNPEIEPPPAVLAAARRVLDSRELHLHAYMPNAGHPRVREAVAGRLRAATGLAYTGRPRPHDRGRRRGPEHRAEGAAQA